MKPSSLSFWEQCNRAAILATNENPGKALLDLVKQPAFDPNFEYQGKTLAWQVAALDPDAEAKLAPLTRADLMETLIQAGAQPWQKTKGYEFSSTQDLEIGFRGLGPWKAAVENASWEVARILLQQPGRPEWSDLVSIRCFSPQLGNVRLFHLVEQNVELPPWKGLGQQLLNLGMPANTSDAEGTTLLFHARSEALMKALLEAGADPEYHDPKGQTAYAYHLEKGLNAETRRMWKRIRANQGKLLDERKLLALIVKGKHADIDPMLPTQADRVAWRTRIHSVNRELNYMDAAACCLLTYRSEKPQLSVARRVQSLLKKEQTWPISSKILARLAVKARLPQDKQDQRTHSDTLADIAPEQAREAFDLLFKIKSAATSYDHDLTQNLWEVLPMNLADAVVASRRAHFEKQPHPHITDFSFVPMVRSSSETSSPIKSMSGEVCVVPNWEKWNQLSSPQASFVASVYLAHIPWTVLKNENFRRMETEVCGKLLPFLARHLNALDEQPMDFLGQRAKAHVSPDHLKRHLDLLQTQMEALRRQCSARPAQRPARRSRLS